VSDGGGVEHLGECRGARLGIAPTGRWLLRRQWVLRNRATQEIIARGRLFSLRRQKPLYEALFTRFALPCDLTIQLASPVDAAREAGP
jgi:hypothetical protein